MSKPCKQCSYVAICLTAGFEVIFNAAALQFAKEHLSVGDHTCGVVQLKSGARKTIETVQQVLPKECPNLQRGCLIGVKMGVEVNGPVVDVVI